VSFRERGEGRPNVGIKRLLDPKKRRRMAQKDLKENLDSHPLPFKAQTSARLCIHGGGRPDEKRDALRCGTSPNGVGATPSPIKSQGERGVKKDIADKPQRQSVFTPLFDYSSC